MKNDQVIMKPATTMKKQQNLKLLITILNYHYRTKYLRSISREEFNIGRIVFSISILYSLTKKQQHSNSVARRK